jgi:hypothetical protein
MGEPPKLTDEQKAALMRQLESWGLVTRVDGCFKLTLAGHLAGAMLTAVALMQQEARPTLN